MSSAQFGMSRLRNKGGAKPDSFYDLLNCYVTADRSIVPRPGTVRDTGLPSGTAGLMAFEDKLWTFSGTPQASPDPNRYVIYTLTHPDQGSSASLVKIHFAKPFLGFPYIVAEWSDGNVYHYWAQGTGTWTADTIYAFNAMVSPTTDNGYVYKATRLGDPNPTWEPGRVVAIGDILEPTVPNGYMYEVVETTGDNPITGATEPFWTASPDAAVYEDVSLGSATTAPPSNAPTTPPSVGDRYGNQGGSGGRLTIPRAEQ